MFANEERLLTVWKFLSLDAVCGIRNCLWLNFIELNRFQMFVTSIQRIIEPYFNHEEKYYSESKIINYNICKMICDNEIDFAQLNWWIQNIFINGGSDRLAEAIYFTVVFDIYNDRVKCSNSIYSKIIKFVEKYRNLIQENKQITKKIDVNNFSLYDKKIHVFENYSDDFLETKISLILEYNCFLEVWSNIFRGSSNDDLLEIFELGKKNQNNLAGETLTFHSLVF